MSFVRERPPLQLHATIVTPDNSIYRWGLDEDLPTNTPRDLTFSTTMPGGFDQCSLTLARKSGIDYSDLEAFSTASILGLGGSETAWQGRLERQPRVSGDQMAVSPGLVGWQAHLDDNKAAREIYVDIDMTRWQDMPPTRRLGLAAGGWNYGASGAASGASTPTLALPIESPWAQPIIVETWYDARGLPISSLWIAWKIATGLNPADSHWAWKSAVCDDETAASADVSSNLRAAGPGSTALTATTNTRRFAVMQLYYDIAYTAGSGGQYELDITNATVVGNHGITLGGSWGATPGTAGPTASQVLAHAVSKYAPRLATKRAGVSTIMPSGFLIPHLTFLDPTTCSEIITQANKYELYDWFVDEGPTFNYAPRGSYGRSWRARVGPSRLSETGPQVDKIWNGVIVTYNDTTNVSRTVGPPGSGANTEDSRLVDTDPGNPANTLPNLWRWTTLQMNTVGKNPDTGLPESAIRIGELFLAQQKELNTSGDATLVGHVEDDHGILWPSWMVRAGDTIRFVDAHDPVSRRIVKTEYTDSTKSCQISLDSPPEALQAYLDRLSVSLQPLGFQ